VFFSHNKSASARNHPANRALVTAKDAERKSKLGKGEYSESNRKFVTCQDRLALKFYSQLSDADTELQYAYNKAQ
jgi:hypothetical protein